MPEDKLARAAEPGSSLPTDLPHFYRLLFLLWASEVLGIPLRKDKDPSPTFHLGQPNSAVPATGRGLLRKSMGSFACWKHTEILSRTWLSIDQTPHKQELKTHTGEWKTSSEPISWDPTSGIQHKVLT